MNKIQSETEEIAKRLEEGVRDVFHSQKYMDYLKVMSQFHEYSLNNTLLIMMQRPSASIVAGYNAWKQMGRQVNRGEKGIRILAPSPYTLKVEQTQKNEKGEIIKDQKGNAVKEIVEIKKIAFRPVSVFDVEQTAGKELPQLTSALIGTSEKYRQIFTAISKVSDIPIVTESITGSQIKGYCTRDKIVLNESNSDLQNLKTLVHELAHHKLHFSPENELKSRQTKEVEAESIAYMVCQHFGIDTSEYSFGYIAGWSSGKDVNNYKDIAISSSVQNSSKIANGEGVRLLEEEKEDLKEKIKYNQTAQKYSVQIAEAVLQELLRRDRKYLDVFSANMFMKICKAIRDSREPILNLPGFINWCLDHINNIQSQRAGREVSRAAFNTMLHTNYDYAALERELISN